MTETLFILFALFTIACGLGVVFSKNPIYSSFSLVLCFFGLSAVYVMWGAIFMAMLQILVYTGAIVVLFVFVVMLLDLVRPSTSPMASAGMAILTGAVVWVLALCLLRTLNHGAVAGASNPALGMVSMRNISMLLFSEYLWPFEVLSVFLLALIIASFTLARPEGLEEADSREVKP